MIKWNASLLQESMGNKAKFLVLALTLVFSFVQGGRDFRGIIRNFTPFFIKLVLNK